MKDHQLLLSLSENHSLQKWAIQKHSKPCDEVHFFQECPTPVQWKRRFEESFHDVATTGLQFSKFEDKFASSFRTIRRTFRRKAGKLGKSEFGESKVDILKFFFQAFENFFFCIFRNFWDFSWNFCYYFKLSQCVSEGSSKFRNFVRRFEVLKS